MFAAKVLEITASDDVRTVVEVGAGRRWAFPARTKIRLGLRLIGIDIDANEMDHNPLLDERIAIDICSSRIPGELRADLVTIRYGVEHFRDNAKAISNCVRLLNPGGRLVVVFPNRYAPFAILNGLGPHGLSKLLVHTLVPGSQTEQGFRAYYDRANYRAFRSILSKAALVDEYHYASYFSSGYFSFFSPLYAISLTLDMLRFALGWRLLAPYHVFVARKADARDGTAGASLA